MGGGSELWTPSGTLFVDAAFGAGVRILLPLQVHPRARLHAFASLVAAIDDINEDPALAASLDIAIAVGVAPEFFLTDQLSVSTDLAVEATIQDLTQPAYAINIATTGAGLSSVGGVSFHWYLP